MNNQILIFILLGLIVFGLSIYLGFLLVKLKKQKADQKHLQEKYEEQFNKRQNELYQSLYTLALVMEQGQVGIAEGCIRIKKLIDLDDDLRFHADLSDFHKAYMDFSDLAYLDSYKELSNQEKFKQDLKRQKFEEIHEETLVQASKNLKEIISKLL